MKINKIKKSKGFTLIELLIVIGILAVLAVTLLLALNPAEAQKRTRDTKRLRDAATLQAIINQYLETGANVPIGCLQSGGGPCRSNSIVGNAPQPCTIGNWLGINVCAYAQTVPVDPNNGQIRTFITGASGNIKVPARYLAMISGSNYEINVLLEAEANRALLTTDSSAGSPNFYEVFSNVPDIITIAP